MSRPVDVPRWSLSLRGDTNARSLGVRSNERLLLLTGICRYIYNKLASRGRRAFK